MAWRGLHISRPCRLTLTDGQCVVTQDGAETRLALEDLAWIILDTAQATLTTSLLSACMDAGIALVVTDSRHHPSGLVLPFHRHHRQANIAGIQLGATAALRNRLWQVVVRGKIRNQAAILDICADGAAPLLAMADRVESGDPDNIEARAARHYWSRLFPDFVRQNSDDLRNAMLDYGYAVMRAAVARALVAAGLLPSIGLHHASAVNPFNLADDLLEPFRPIVDRMVWRLSDHGIACDGKLTLEHRRSLAGVLLETTCFGGEMVTALIATEMAVVSLVRAFEAATAKILLLPKIENSK
ncbi:MAG: subtype II CRISPR-associated endonuclease Cas1 [Rhodospirillales bacterium 20-60-12]|nr:MAG: subtype II CRISPR-associated endonuclease Cas1 [Rhodospirillales bacterium 20-60-12]HQT67620.1 type II CRISPR-associated endonuclease Cas1 [Acetobacteraceae bacterium]